jgi:hypothetical protein
MNYNKCDYSAIELVDGVIFRMKDDITGFYKLVDNENITIIILRMASIHVLMV